MILHSINRQTKLFSYFFMRQSSIPAQFENLPLARTQLFQSLCNQFLNILFLPDSSLHHLHNQWPVPSVFRIAQIGQTENEIYRKYDFLL